MAAAQAFNLVVDLGADRFASPYDQTLAADAADGRGSSATIRHLRLDIRNFTSVSASSGSIRPMGKLL